LRKRTNKENNEPLTWGLALLGQDVGTSAYLGSLASGDKQKYRQSEIEAAPQVVETFSGHGALNRYFREILYRLEKKAYR
jgi:hypothetical protein